MDTLPPPPAAAQDAASRTARHLAMLQELADLGMQLARRAAQEALEDQPATETARRARPDPNLVFARLARTVRDTIALEARLAAGKRPAAPPPGQGETDGDPRRPAIRAFMHDVIDASPHPASVQAGFRAQLEDLITEGLATDPAQEHPGGAIVFAICEELGLKCDIAEMPDELLTPPHRDYTQAERDSVADAVARLIHAQDPP